MKGNIRFIICQDSSGGFKVIAAYGADETVWSGFKTVTQAGDRILEACKTLDQPRPRAGLGTNKQVGGLPQGRRPGDVGKELTFNGH